MATPQEIKNVRIKFRIANDSKWKDKNAILDAGEIGIVLNNSQTKIEKMLIGRKDGELAKDAIAFYPGEGAQYKLPEATTSKTGGIKINKHYFKMENGMLEPIHLRKSVADEHGIYYNNDNKPSHSAWEMSKDSDLKINGDLYTEDIYANKIKCTDLVNETKTEYNTIGDYVKLRINESQDEEEYVGENITLVKDVYGEPIASFNLLETQTKSIL